MSLIAAIISGVAAIGSAIAGNVGAKRRDERNNRAQSHLNQQNIDLVNAQNEYNSPKNQVARNIEAGLNPYYGNISSGNQTSLAPQGALQYSNYGEGPASAITQLGGLINTIQQVEMNSKHIENLSAQNALLKAQKLNVDSQTAKNASQTKMFDYDLSFRSLSERERYNAIKLQNDYKFAAANRLNQDLQFDYGINPAIDYQYGWSNPRKVSLWQSKKDNIDTSTDLRDQEYLFNEPLQKLGFGKDTPWWIKNLLRLSSQF